MSNRLQMWPRNTRLDCQTRARRPWVMQVNEVHPPGSHLYQYVNLVSVFTRVPSWTPVDFHHSTAFGDQVGEVHNSWTRVGLVKHNSS